VQLIGCFVKEIHGKLATGALGSLGDKRKVCRINYNELPYTVV